LATGVKQYRYEEYTALTHQQCNAGSGGPSGSLAHARVLGEDVNLLKRFSGNNEGIYLAHERVVHRGCLAGKKKYSRGFSAKCGAVVVDQVIKHFVRRRPVGRLASLAVSSRIEELCKHLSFHVQLHNRIKKDGICLYTCCH
jgi:hypothetical protein